MLRVAIVGCGKVADAHVSQIRRVTSCEIVGVCDCEALMADQLAERFGIEGRFRDLTELLRVARPHIVHVTTPPQSHFAVAERCLVEGSHVFVEKPFTVDESQARRLIDLAERNHLKITVGHDDQFRHSARRLRELVREGYLGGPPVHMESHYCYPLAAGGAYARALLGDCDHWVRQLPGQLFHNIISHGIARIAEYISGDSLTILAHGFTSPRLRQMGERRLMDELRVTLCDGRGVTAYFTFSTQMRPALHQFRIYGPRNGLVLDQDNETLIQLGGDRFKSYAEHFLSPLVLASQYAGSTWRNVRRFLANDFHPKSGLQYLIDAFYRAIESGTAVPIPYREIVLTAHIMDEIFRQIAPAESHDECPVDSEQRAFSLAHM